MVRQVLEVAILVSGLAVVTFVEFIRVLYFPRGSRRPRKMPRWLIILVLCYILLFPVLDLEYISRKKKEREVQNA